MAIWRHSDKCIHILNDCSHIELFILYVFIEIKLEITIVHIEVFGNA